MEVIFFIFIFFFHKITQPQNGKGWKGPLVVTLSKPSVQARQLSASCPEPCPADI